MNKEIDTRPFTAFAFLAEKMRQGGDIVSGVIPLFKPVIAPLKGRVFDPVDLGERIGDYYGLDIHPYAVEDIAPRLEAEGLLSRRQLSVNSFGYIYAPVEGGFPEIEDSLVENVVGSFLAFSNKLLDDRGVTIEEGLLKSALLDRLTKAEFFGILVKPDKSKDALRSPNTLSLKRPEAQTEWEAQNSLEARLDVLVASFLLDAKANNPDLYDLLIKITTGALVAEVILDFRNPVGLDNLNGIQIILDAPFLMLLFDLGSRVGKVYADKLFEQLKAKGATLSVFQHSLDEFRDNLNAVLNAKERGQAFGETAGRLTDPNFKMYATTLLPVLADRVKERGVSLIIPPPAPSYIYFTEDELTDLMGRINFHSSPVARERDARSIAYVMRLRGGRRVTYKEVKNCGSIFLTRNSGLVSITEKQLHKSGRLAQRDVPPCITDRYFAGLLWVMFGGARDGLPEYRLLANCARAVQSREDVIEKMHDILTETNPEHAVHFKALMTTDRGSQYFMQLTLGDSLLVTNENYQQIYSQLEEVAGEKVAKQKNEEIQRLRSEHQEQIGRLKEELQADVDRDRREALETIGTLEAKSLEAAKQFQQALQEATTEALNKAEEARKAQEQADLNAREAEKIRKEKEDVELATVKMAVSSGCSVRKKTKAIVLGVLVVFFVGLNLIDKYVLPELDVHGMAARLSLPVYLLVVLLQFVLTLWFIPDKIFGNFAARKQMDATNEFLTRAGMEGSLDRYEVDWDQGVVKKKMTYDFS